MGTLEQGPGNDNALLVILATQRLSFSQHNACHSREGGNDKRCVKGLCEKLT